MSFLTLADGTRVRGADRGAGPAVVLVHGWKGSHRLWDATAVELVARGHRVVAFDLRGMGESDKPRSAYDFDVFSDDLVELLERHALDDVTLVGWSMGCTVVLRHLERGAARVGRAVLLNGPLRLTRADDFPHAMPAEQLDAYLQAMTSDWPRSERAFQAESLWRPDPATVDWLTAIALQTPLDVALTAVRAQARLDMRDAVRRAAVPLLAAYGRHDPYYPVTLGEWIAEAAPDGRAVVFERSAHGTPFEQAADFAETVAGFAVETAAVR